MKIKPYPTKAQLRKLFDYAEGQFVRSGISFTGGLVWRPKVDVQGRPNTRTVGEFAGFVDSKKERLQVSINERRYELGRLVWIWHHGNIANLIDHKNRDSRDNRVSNLRPATHNDNNANRKKTPGTSSQYVGVYLNKRGKWIAQIKSQGRVQYLGSFDDEVSAARARDRACKTLHKEFGNINVCL